MCEIWQKTEESRQLLDMDDEKFINDQDEISAQLERAHQVLSEFDRVKKSLGPTQILILVVATLVWGFGDLVPEI